MRKVFGSVPVSTLPKMISSFLLEEIHVTLISSNVLLHIHTLIFDFEYLVENNSCWRLLDDFGSAAEKPHVGRALVCTCVAETEQGRVCGEELQHT